MPGYSLFCHRCFLPFHFAVEKPHTLPAANYSKVFSLYSQLFAYHFTDYEQMLRSAPSASAETFSGGGQNSASAQRGLRQNPLG